MSKNFEFEDSKARGISNNDQRTNSSLISIIKLKLRRKYFLLFFLAAINKNIIKGIAKRSGWNNLIESIPLSEKT